MLSRTFSRAFFLFCCRLRHGPEVCINFIVDILPQIITDFLPPMEVLQTVVTDFISPHQSRPQLSATIMAQVCWLTERSKQSHAHVKKNNI